MSTPIPGFATQVNPSGSETVEVAGGSLQTLAVSRYYYFVSNATAAGTANGQSLLKALKDMLDASLPGTHWTVVLTNAGGLYRVQLFHDSGTSKTVTLSATFAANLGFASASFAVPASTAVLANYPSVWWWTPDMPVSLTGPTPFDQSLSFGVPASAGASQRAPDMTLAYVQNGVQWSAEYTFNGVQFYYKVKPQAAHPNEDLETWWLNGPAQGRRFLMWRDRNDACSSDSPGSGTASPYKYIEYGPQETLRSTYPAQQTAPANLVYWDVKLDCWVTQNGERPLTGNT